MKLNHKELLEEIKALNEKQNFLLEQIIRLLCLNGNHNLKQQVEIKKIIMEWWGTDLKHHTEENDLIKKVIQKD